MAELDPALISPMTGRIRVLPTQQVCPSRLASVENTEKQFSKSFMPTVTPPLTSSSATSIGSDEDQLQTQKDYNHIFAIGDCAQTKAIQAGHTAFGQGEVAARNILRLIEKEGEARKINDEELEEYEAPKPAIKLTLGIVSLLSCFDRQKCWRWRFDGPRVEKWGTGRRRKCDA